MKRYYLSSQRPFILEATLKIKAAETVTYPDPERPFAELVFVYCLGETTAFFFLFSKAKTVSPMKKRSFSKLVFILEMRSLSLLFKIAETVSGTEKDSVRKSSLSKKRPTDSFLKQLRWYFDRKRFCADSVFV